MGAVSLAPIGGSCIRDRLVLYCHHFFCFHMNTDHYARMHTSTFFLAFVGTQMAYSHGKVTVRQRLEGLYDVAASSFGDVEVALGLADEDEEDSDIDF